ncbi:MAG: zinc ribbon domain-containing protein [Acidobacteria bacterium]|nr:zinc ribbon domain-containing protein [Acidobacteriota bacterium]
MPIYEYKCLQCGEHFEKRQSVSDAPLTTCEKCHGKLEKQWSLSGFQFKGAGWYVTDYAGKNGPKTETSAAGPEKTTSSESTSSSETASKPTSDTKPAASGGGSKSGGE